MTNRKKQNIYTLPISILCLLLMLIIAIFFNTTYRDSSLYDNIGIDNQLLNILYFNVGQADSTLITANDYTMLIDTGNESDGAYISDFLMAQNIRRIDYLIITHFDEDHMGGAYKIMEDLDIGIVYTPNNSQESSVYSKMMETVRIHKININKDLQASDELQYRLRRCTMESVAYKWQ